MLLLVLLKFIYSVSYSDVHEDGIIRMMLCRVIMGNVEVVLPGSKQFQQSNESFDSGVDDLQNPKHYIIWDANVHKQIYAEYAVIVNIPPTINGIYLYGSFLSLSTIFRMYYYLPKTIYLVLVQNV